MPEQLMADEFLLPGQSLDSVNGLYRLQVQTDGNLVLLSLADEHVLWKTNTEGNSSTGGWPRLWMQADGNLVLVLTAHPDIHPSQVLFATNTDGHPGSHLEMQDDGNAVVYDPDHVPLWASNDHPQ